MSELPQTGTPESAAVHIRLMNATDLRRGFLAALSALRPTELTDEEAILVFRRRMRQKIRTYVALLENRVVGTASLIIEPKFLHGGGVVGHIEDVAVHQAYHHHGVGGHLVQRLIDECRALGCYKVILDCEESVEPFYHKLGFRRWNRSMRLDFDPPSK